MAFLGEGGFDANTVEPNSFECIPAGEYDAVIVNSEVKTTSKGDGKYLNLELQILNGQFQNRKLFDKLNLWNPNPQAVQIAKGTLSAICRAVNVLTPKDSAELHNKPLRIKVVVSKSEQYGDQNQIKAYKPRGSVSSAPVANVAPQASQQTVTTAANGAPW